MQEEICVLVLGGGGFVGSHLRSALLSRFGPQTRMIFTSATSRDHNTLKVDIRDTEAVRAILRAQRPSHVINLVGIAAPVKARQDPALAWELHALAPSRLGYTMLADVPDCWLFHVSSGLVYGRSAVQEKTLDEKVLLDPMDMYAVTKAAGDLAMGVLAGEGLKCLRLRPFNHTGPGQTKDFAVPAFAAQLANIKAGLQDPVINVGNLDAVRDFLDVRDVADAYTDLVAHSDTIQSGAIYNIASGEGKNMRQILDQLIALSGLAVEVMLDPERQRPSDLARIVGNAQALHQATGWRPARALNQTLYEILQYFENEVAGSKS